MSTINPSNNDHMRMIWNEDKEKWYFVLADIVKVVVQPANARAYLKQIHQHKSTATKKWEKHVSFQLIITEGGKQPMKCTHALGLLHFFDTVPSRTAEPFRQWLKQLCIEKSSEFDMNSSNLNFPNDFQLSSEYVQNWIKQRIQNLSMPIELEARWQCDNIKKQREYAILASSITTSPYALSRTQWEKWKQKIQAKSPHPIADLEILFASFGKFPLQLNR